MLVVAVGVVVEIPAVAMGVVAGGVVAVVAEVVDVRFAASTRGASAALSGRSTPSLPQVVFLLSATMDGTSPVAARACSRRSNS